jgi:hypothetical protein
VPSQVRNRQNAEAMLQTMSSWQRSGNAIGFSKGKRRPDRRATRRAAVDAVADYNAALRDSIDDLAGYPVGEAAATAAVLNSIIPINRYREVDDYRLLAAGELAAILLARSTTAGGATLGAVKTSDSIVRDVGHALTRLRDAILASSTHLSLSEIRAESGFEVVRFRFVNSAKLVRCMALDSQLRATLTALFSDTEVDRAITRIGLPGGLEVLAVVNGIIDQLNEAIADSRAAASGQRVWPLPKNIPALAQACCFDAESLSKRTGVSVPVAEQSLELLRLAPTVAVPDVTGSTQEARLKPLIATANGDVCTVPQNLLPAIRIRIEDTLKTSKDAAAWETYKDHRAAWVEREAVRILGAFLGAPLAKTNISLMRGKRRVGEIDGLLVLEHVAIVVEAKSAGLRALAWQDDADAIKTNVEELFEKAGAQLQRARASLVAPASAVLKDSSGHVVPVNPGTISEIYTISLTLEDASFVGPVIWALQDDGILDPSEPVPWAVSLDQLDTICRVLEWPAQFIDWLRARAAFAGQRVIRSHDELDLFAAHLDNSLNLHYPHADHVMLPSGTDPIVAWMLYKEGVKPNPSPRPRQRVDDGLTLRRKMRELHQARDPGWLTEALELLETHRGAPPNVRSMTLPAR